MVEKVKQPLRNRYVDEAKLEAKLKSLFGSDYHFEVGPRRHPFRFSSTPV